MPPSDALLGTLKRWTDKAALSPFSCITVTLSELRKIVAHEEAKATKPFQYPRDREGFALCHHGRRIACNECVAEEERTDAAV